MSDNDKMPLTHTMPTSMLVKKFIPYYKPHMNILLFDLLCAAFTSVGELLLPLIIRSITGRASDGTLTLSFIGIMGVVYIILRIIDTAAQYFMNNRGHVMGAAIETDMRRDLFSHLQRLSFKFYDETKVGQIMARMTSDLFDITEFSHHCPEEFFIAGLKIIIAFVILININVPLTLIMFAQIPLMIICTVNVRIKMRRAFKMSRNQIGEINAGVEDSLLGVRVVKSFANEAIESKKFDKGNNDFYDIKKLQYKYMAGFHATVRAFDALMYISVVVIGGIFMLRGSISPADLTAYVLYANTMLQTIKRIVEFAENFQKGMTGIERFLEIMNVEEDIKDAPDAIELKDVKGNIRFENVTFKYDESKVNVLEKINIDIKAGENAAFVGPSGGGKTTICSLIPRFYDVTGGRITIDGKDIRHLTLQSLRSNIGIVQQDVYLFSGTVYENIEYGKPGASKEEIIQAAKLAGAHEFISELPEGYNSYVGERGVKLSGGQKQRISIARVFLKNPPILILDEATSALDNESERLVQQSLERLAAGRTTLTVAHRLTTVKNSDYIIVLTDGNIAERGSHNELMQKKGIYADLYNLYTEN